MSREVRRVPLDFDWPLDKVWHGYLSPDELDEENCRPCDGSGYGPMARHLHSRWYGKVPFHPSETGSALLTVETPEVRAFAERNVTRAPQFYGGTSEAAIVREAKRLSDMWNSMWCHHLSQYDVNALVHRGRLIDFTHTWGGRETRWQPRDPMPPVLAAEVNAWSLRGMGHDSISAMICVEAACVRLGVDQMCSYCGGHGSTERYPGQRADAEAWERTDPPKGKGWQYWETVSEGSPISPVFATAEELSHWLQTDYHWGSSGPLSKEQADGMVRAGWAPSGVITAAGVVAGDAMYGEE